MGNSKDVYLLRRVYNVGPRTDVCSKPDSGHGEGFVGLTSHFLPHFVMSYKVFINSYLPRTPKGQTHPLNLISSGTMESKCFTCRCRAQNSCLMFCLLQRQEATIRGYVHRGGQGISIYTHRFWCHYWSPVPYFLRCRWTKLSCGALILVPPIWYKPLSVLLERMSM